VSFRSTHTSDSDFTINRFGKVLIRLQEAALAWPAVVGDSESRSKKRDSVQRTVPVLRAVCLNNRGVKAGMFATAEDYAAGMERIAAAFGVSEN
jgi:hypothetical protein